MINFLPDLKSKPAYQYIKIEHFKVSLKVSFDHNTEINNVVQACSVLLAINQHLAKRMTLQY